MCKNEQDATKTSDELLMQLHEQYAINNNSSMEAIVSLLVSMFAAFGAYGYVWTHCGTASEKFELANLTFAATGASFILVVMSYICMYQGTSQRLEQFVTYKIRDRYKIATFFPKGYDPYFKKGLEVVQGLYGEFVKIFPFVFLFVWVSFLFKVNELEAIHLGNKYLTLAIFNFVAYLILNILFLFYNVRRYRCRIKYLYSSKENEDECSAFDCCFMNLCYGLFEFVVCLLKKCSQK